MRPMLRRVAALAATAIVLTACSDGGEPQADPEATTPSPLPRATEAPRPEVGACYRLTFDEALGYTSDIPATSCRKAHTSVTYAVGDLDNVVHGHLVAVDSRRVKDQVARTCPRRLGDHVGGTLAQRRLSMLRPVWFTPTVEESDAGAGWFRCDVIAVARDDHLANLRAGVKGALGTAEGRDRWGMCGTAEPGADDFERVLCSLRHTWRAVEVVTFPEGKYPGERAAAAHGREQCKDAGNDAAEDPLDFQWGYEWPTADQWDAGTTYGLCWVPSEQ
jgi:hypothetical protein